MHCAFLNRDGGLHIKQMYDGWISNAKLNCAANKTDSKIREWMHVLMQSIF